MLSHTQNSVVYLMFLSGLLFLGLNFVASCMVNPGPKRGKRFGYLFIVVALLTFLIQEEYSVMLSLDFTREMARNILLAGLSLPVFFISLFYYRVKAKREKQSTTQSIETTHGND
ncbi:MAG: RTA1 domain-containing protein [Candidatus Nitrohelix vancouverensis]|uniref:RTA1 domain-containing protein n=1 Tax=Candidatus Nitrohelix vancouverensis TaxID=2705534 RepID=A0A7T0C2Z6_9BACT|nr:MAG: RTA1 domain-containing protein [Candidatus Nitrohelix vancouverensis]